MAPVALRGADADEQKAFRSDRASSSSSSSSSNNRKTQEDDSPISILSEIVSTDTFYLSELDRLLLYEPPLSLASAVDAIKSVHIGLTRLSVSNLSSLSCQLQDVYSQYLESYKYDPEDSERYGYLKKRPFSRLSYLAKMMVRMEQCSNADMGASLLTILASKSRACIQTQLEEIDSTRFCFSKVRSFATFQPVSGSFDPRTIVQRDLFEFQLLLPSNKWSSKITAELLILSTDSLAICSMEYPGRSLMFPVFRRGDLHITKSAAPLVMGSPASTSSKKRTVKQNLVMCSEGKYVRILSSDANKLRSWEWKLRQLMESHGRSESGSTVSSDGLGISIAPSPKTPQESRPYTSGRVRPPPRSGSSGRSLSSMASSSSSFKRLSLLLGDETFELSEQLKDILLIDDEPSMAISTETVGQAILPKKEWLSEPTTNQFGLITPDSSLPMVDESLEDQEEEGSDPRSPVEQATSRPPDRSYRLRLNKSSSLYMYATEDVDLNDKLSSAPPSNPPEFLPLPPSPTADVGEKSARKSYIVEEEEQQETDQVESRPPIPSGPPPPLPTSATSDTALSELVSGEHEHGASASSQFMRDESSLSDDVKPLLESQGKDKSQQGCEYSEVLRTRQLLKKRLGQNDETVSSESPSILSGLTFEPSSHLSQSFDDDDDDDEDNDEEPDQTSRLDKSYLLDHVRKSMPHDESSSSMANSASNSSLAVSVELSTPYMASSDDDQLGGAKAPSPLLAWLETKKNKDISNSGGSLVRRLTGSIKKAVTVKVRKGKTEPSFDILQPPVNEEPEEKEEDITTNRDIEPPHKSTEISEQREFEPISNLPSPTSPISSSDSAVKPFNEPSSSSSMPGQANDHNPMVTLFRAISYLSKWDQERWTAVSEKEVPIQVSVSGEGGVIYVSNWAKLSLSPKQEIRKSTAHDVQISQGSKATMFRFRAPDVADRFYEALQLSRVDVKQQPLLYYHRQTSTKAPSLNSNDSSLGSLSSLEPPGKKPYVRGRNMSRNNSFNTVSTIFEEEEEDEEDDSSKSQSSMSSSSSADDLVVPDRTPQLISKGTHSLESLGDKPGIPQLLLLNNLRCRLHGVDIQAQWTGGEVGRLSVFSVAGSARKAVLVRPLNSKEPMFFEQSIGKESFSRVGKVGISISMDDNPPRWLLQFKGEKEAAHVYELLCNE